MIETHSRSELPALADEIVGAMPRLDAVEQRLAIELYRLLAQGQPVEPERLSRHAAVPLEGVTGHLSSWPGVYRDTEGRVIGFWGLTIAEMPPHRLEVNGQTLWTWCAWDALFIPMILGAPVRVDSICATTGEPSHSW